VCELTAFPQLDYRDAAGLSERGGDRWSISASKASSTGGKLSSANSTSITRTRRRYDREHWPIAITFPFGV
jgi:hypothetical protein